MRELSGKTAVVTGAASGIGRALSEQLAREGMRVILADIEEQPLAEAADELQRGGFEVRGIVTDVSRAESIEALAERATEAFGGIHLLCNSAGVSVGGGAPWERTLDDWEWVFNVNFRAVLHAIRTFVPRMLAGDEPGHIVNVASINGLLLRDSGIYSVSKAATVRLSEYLLRSLQQRNAPIGVTVVCPDAVQTHILSSGRNRPSELAHTVDIRGEAEIREARSLISRMMRGWTSAEMARLIVDAVREDRFWLIPLKTSEAELQLRMNEMLERRNPRYDV